jgi:hypothetical protein
MLERLHTIWTTPLSALTLWEALLAALSVLVVWLLLCILWAFVGAVFIAVEEARATAEYRRRGGR